MRWLLAAVTVASACATSSPQPTPTASTCSLERETLCAAYGATIAGASTPAAQLVIGLADRANELPPEDAVDYWRRIEEVVESGDKSNDVVNRRAARAYAGLAELEHELRRTVGDDETDLEEQLAATEAVHQRLVTRAEFAVKWGDPAVQAIAARALAQGYADQADALARVRIPDELTAVGRASLEARRDGIVAELRAESERLAAGVLAHCRKHGLEQPACSPR